MVDAHSSAGVLRAGHRFFFYLLRHITFDFRFLKQSPQNRTLPQPHRQKMVNQVKCFDSVPWLSGPAQICRRIRQGTQLRVPKFPHHVDHFCFHFFHTFHMGAPSAIFVFFHSEKNIKFWWLPNNGRMESSIDFFLDVTSWKTPSSVLFSR